MSKNVWLTPSREAQIIIQRALERFSYHQHVRYRLLIVNDSYNRQYNFFLEWRRPVERSRSVPLHSVHEYDVAYLQQVLVFVQRQIGFSVVLRDFEQSDIHLLQKS